LEIHISTPEKKDYRQDTKAIKEWLEITYPSIVEKAKEEDAEIWWLDESGARNESNYVKGYAPRGKTPTLPVASVHIGVNMISSITSTGKLRYHFYREKFNQGIFMSFLKRLIKGDNKKVFAIVDNLKTHHGLLVQEWKDRNAEFIEIFYLPSYAPELNPTEYLNNNLKRVLLNKGYSKNEDEIQKKAISSMRSIQSTKNRIASFFDNEFVKYAKFHE
jgi:transposase